MTVVAKYMAFRDPVNLQMEASLYDINGLRNFVTANYNAGVKTAGVLGKLDSLLIAVRYVSQRIRISKEGVNTDELLEQIRTWKGTSCNFCSYKTFQKKQTVPIFKTLHLSRRHDQELSTTMPRSLMVPPILCNSTQASSQQLYKRNMKKEV